MSLTKIHLDILKHLVKAGGTGNVMEFLKYEAPDFQKGFLEYIRVNLKRSENKVSDSLITIYRAKPLFDQGALNKMVNNYK